jgi:hypothetical protein
LISDLIDDLIPGFKQMCSVQADLSGLRGGLVQSMGTKGYYWTLNFDIGIRFGGTELEAFIEWKEGV